MPRAVLTNVLQERGLPHAGVPARDQCSALADSDRRQQACERPQLAIAPHQMQMSARVGRTRASRSWLARPLDWPPTLACRRMRCTDDSSETRPGTKSVCTEREFHHEARYEFKVHFDGAEREALTYPATRPRR